MKSDFKKANFELAPIDVRGICANKLRKELTKIAPASCSPWKKRKAASK